MSRTRGWIAVALTGVTCVGVLAASVHRWWTAPLSVGKAGTVVVREGDTVAGLAGRMERAGLLDQPHLLRWTTRIGGFAGSLQVGEYLVTPGDTPQRLMRRIVAGDVISYRFRIGEGTRVASVLADLAAHPRIAHTLADVSPAELLTVLGVDEDAGTGHGEGWFFPDTYRFVAGNQDRSLLLRAHRKMRRELDAAWAGRSADLPYRTAYEALTVASIIEKETGHLADRADVSQVIAARLGREMPLQVDPTVIYGIGEAFDGNLTRAHLRQPTPYNTYIHAGLPPTPIGLPGRDALHAAMHPSGAPWLYFVSRGDGSSEFSTTLREHRAAVRKYQRRQD